MTSFRTTVFDFLAFVLTAASPGLLFYGLTTAKEDQPPVFPCVAFPSWSVGFTELVISCTDRDSQNVRDSPLGNGAANMGVRTGGGVGMYLQGAKR